MGGKGYKKLVPCTYLTTLQPVLACITKCWTSPSAGATVACVLVVVHAQVSRGLCRIIGMDDVVVLCVCVSGGHGIKWAEREESVCVFVDTARGVEGGVLV